MKYPNQYESSYDPWPVTVMGWVAWIIFMMPGTLILWFSYMFPTRGQIWGSDRRAQNRIVTVMTTLSLYLFVTIWISILFAARNSSQP